MWDYMAGEADGGGAGIGIDDDFEAVLEDGELDQVADNSVGLEGVEAGLNHRGLKFPGIVFGHSRDFGKTADGATGSGGEARVSVEMQRDTFRVSGH